MKDKSKITDKKLVLEYQSGNRKVIAVLVKRWHIQFCKLAFYYVNDADVAKDIAQESWQTILKKLDELKNPKQFKSWAISIVNRKSIDYLRANKRILNKHQKYHAENKNEFVSEEINEQDVIKDNLLKAIQKLPTQQQVVIRLFYLESYSLKEISEILEISIGTSKSRLFHAREKLKKIIKYRNHEE